MYDARRTLVIPVRGDQVWLGEKKRGHGSGFLNGFGGKIEAGESIEAALVRECQEEAGITPTSYRKVSEIEFHNPSAKPEDRRILLLTYTCDKWQGKPVETDEMRPIVFDLAKLPLNRMWPADKLWLPRVLVGKKLKGEIWFDKNNKLLNYRVEEVNELA